MQEYNARPVLTIPSEIEEKGKKFEFNFADNKFIFYSALFYSFGLFLGSFFYKSAKSNNLNKILALSDNSFINLFLADFCLYFSIFLIVTFLGFCLLSNPVINVVPAIIGFITGIKLAYYYISFSTRGVGYSLIMIVPYIALFVTVITFVIKESTELSAKIKMLTKGEGESSFELTPYLKKYLILGLLIVATALINSCLSKLLFSVVTI